MRYIWPVILSLIFTSTLWAEVKTAPMSKPDHPQRWYDQAFAEWGDQPEHLRTEERADGEKEALADGLVWQGLSFTSEDVLPFASAGKRIYFIARKGHRTFNLRIDTTQYTLRPNVVLEVGDYDVLLFNQQVAKVAFKLGDRLFYGRRGGILFKESEEEIWEETWRQPQKMHEEKDVRTHKSNLTAERVDFYTFQSSLGNIEAIMLQASDKKKGTKEVWEVKIAPQLEPEEYNLRQHLFLEVKATGAKRELVTANGVVATSTDDTQPFYIGLDDLLGQRLQLHITPYPDGTIDMTGFRIVECRQELLE